MAPPPARPAGGAEPLLQVLDLVWGHRGTPFGGPWSASLARGELLAVLGPNGAGKTTLFRTLIGAVPALAGQVLWSGQAPRTARAAQLAARVAFVPQQTSLAFELTVREFAMLGRLARKGPFAHPASADREAVERALARLELGALADRPLDRLSGGERQLAGVARALAQQAAVLLLDEPTASLDFGNQERVLRQLASLAADGLAVVLSTHQPNHASRLGARVLALDGRGLARYGEAAEVMTPELLSELYGVRVLRADLAHGDPYFVVG